MAGNRIYRGPAERDPETVSGKTVAGAYLPGTFVAEGATTLTQATIGSTPFPRLLSNRDFYSTGQFDTVDPLLVAYASGDSAVAYKVEPGQTYQAAVAAATYAWGTELTIGAAGRLLAATTGQVVVAFSRYVGARAAGDLIDVEIANFYAKV